jgi:hypothetical protein
MQMQMQTRTLGLMQVQTLEQMQMQAGRVPSTAGFVLLYVLEACASLGAIDRDREAHAGLVVVGAGVQLPLLGRGAVAAATTTTTVAVAVADDDEDVLYGNAVLDMYGKCGALQEVRAVFDRLGPRRRRRGI